MLFFLGRTILMCDIKSNVVKAESLVSACKLQTFHKMKILWDSGEFGEHCKQHSSLSIFKG